MKNSDRIESIGNCVTSVYENIERGVVGTYKKFESAVVGHFVSLTDKCIEVLFLRDGESVAEARERLAFKK